MPIDPRTKNWVGPSNSEQYLLNKPYTPQATTLMANSVSQMRKELLGREVEQGLFRDGSSTSDPGNANVLTGAGYVIGSAGSLTKKAQSFGGGGSQTGGGFRGSGDTVMQAPEIYSPLWLSSNMNLPRDRATINAWCRSYFALNPFVNNAISLHSTYPISKLNIKCPNKEVENFFNEMIEEIDLMNICIQIAQEYWCLGEAFVYSELDESAGKWSRLVIQNPDYMVVNRTAIASEPSIALRPDENLKKIVFSNRPSDVAQRKQLNQHIIDSVKRGQNIPLDNYNVSQLARRISPYEIRGTGLPVCIFKQLMLMDKFRESSYVQADTMVNPTTLIKIGSSGADGFKPTVADLEAYREQFEAAENNKSFKIFTHDGVAVERIGFNQGILDTSPSITQLIKEIWIGLEVPSVLADGGADTTYANGGVALDVLRGRYMSFRNMLSAWLKNKIFAPISKIQGFYDIKDGKKKLIIPEIDWNHMSLFDTADYINALMTLSQGEGDQKRVSLHTLYRSMGLEYEDEIRKNRKEAIQNAISLKEKTALETMDLNSLRALDDDAEIKEAATDAKNGTPPDNAGGLPGEDTSGGLPQPPPGLPGLDLGGPSAPPSGGGKGSAPEPAPIVAPPKA